MNKKFKISFSVFLILIFSCFSQAFAATLPNSSSPTLATSITTNKFYDKLNVGQTDTLTALVLPSNSTIKDVIWTSSDPSIATVDSLTGKVTAIKTGKVYITATVQDGRNLHSTCTVEVIKLATGITTNKLYDKLNVGQIDTLTALVLPSNSTIKDVIWTSSDPSIATVDSLTGKVTAIKAGKVYITATVQDGRNLHSTCTIEVI